ncbi:DUF5615 family PIN-like protein [Longispora albida]|uniref:DUF5615 family PIN-like protein n=1 Tax=Longispora albida TaxID=203523 RepID=UPI0003825849|nr:DUF5615 family PIN-like protein [Longispora albida]
MTSRPLRAGVRLLLDEMHSPVIARALRALQYDVVAVAERADLRALPDAEVYAYGVAQDRCVVTENVKDFRRLHAQAAQAGLPQARLLYTSARTFRRTRRDFTPIIDALIAWMAAPHAAGSEAWLRPAGQPPAETPST